MLAARAVVDCTRLVMLSVNECEVRTSYVHKEKEKRIGLMEGIGLASLSGQTAKTIPHYTSECVRHLSGTPR